MRKFFVRVVGLLSLFLVCSSLYQMGYAKYYMYRSEQSFEKQVKVKSVEVKKQEPVVKPAVKEEPLADKEVFLTFPKLKKTVSVVEGIDKKTLLKGVGHYPDTAKPNQYGMSILAGHNDTVFKNLDLLKLGDRVVVDEDNVSTTYYITGKKIVSKDYRLPITDQKKPVLVLITCYPMNMITPAPERLILTAEKSQGN
ncbi:LPXTG-site transpeptidase (sortase) family protein [Bacillus sp. OV166]|uniref:sortase n=1 Tax=Bacillus sp. OV166 TaxID=1882763 RepID=UPI000A2AB223|nr:sortase [Bacillus sp. OV166]SMQ78420.1 LPXTG-site transpeptidase (sortase) family protein [Bacillus sp. OV166]